VATTFATPPLSLGREVNSIMALTRSVPQAAPGPRSDTPPQHDSGAARHYFTCDQGRCEAPSEAERQCPTLSL